MSASIAETHDPKAHVSTRESADLRDEHLILIAMSRGTSLACPCAAVERIRLEGVSAAVLERTFDAFFIKAIFTDTRHKEQDAACDEMQVRIQSGDHEQLDEADTDVTQSEQSEPGTGTGKRPLKTRTLARTVSILTVAGIFLAMAVAGIALGVAGIAMADPGFAIASLALLGSFSLLRLIYPLLERAAPQLFEV